MARDVGEIMSVEGEKGTVRPRRRWYQFSLGSMLLLMTVFGVWFGMRMDRARRQARAVAVLRERGDIVYESAFNHRSLRSLPKKKPSWRPKWLRAIVGDDFFDCVYAAYLYRSPSDDDLEYLRDLPDLETLIIDFSQVTVRGLQHVRALRHLKELSLGHNNLTDADLVHLEPLQELRHLSIFCSMSDEAFDSIAALESLETLDISRGPVSSTGRRAAYALDEPTRIEAQEEPLAFVFDYLKDLHNIPLPVDKEEVRAAGIKWRDIPIEVTVSGQSLERGLDAVLEGTGLGWILTKDGILITTKEKADEMMAPVRDLEKRMPNLKRVVCVVDP